MPDVERFMVVAFTEHHETCRSLPEWPQHVTIMPWMQGYRAQATNRISAAVAEFEPISLQIGQEEQFGPSGEITVWTLEENDILSGLHKAVLGAAIRNGTVLEDMTYAGENYRPHISQKVGQPIRTAGEILMLQQISVIGKHAAVGKTIFRNLTLGVS